MELTREQISGFILKATSSSDGFNQLVEITLNSLMQHERRMFLDETANSCNGFRPRRFCYGHYEFTSVRDKVLSIKACFSQTFIDKFFDWGRIETFSPPPDENPSLLNKNIGIPPTFPAPRHSSSTAPAWLCYIRQSNKQVGIKKLKLPNLSIPS